MRRDPREDPPPCFRCLLGRPLAGGLGVPACPLTASARGIEFLLSQGFNLLTFKTVRSQAWPAHPPPHWLFLSEAGEKSLLPGPLQPGLRLRAEEESRLEDARAFSTLNSFGIPSPPPAVWRREIRDSLSLIGEGQSLMVSILGSCRGEGSASLCEDYRRLALQAAETGAHAIELDLSCPNLLGGGEDKPLAPLSQSLQLAQGVLAGVGEELRGGPPLVIKLGYQPPEQLTPLLRALAPHAHAISGINALPVRALRADGRASFPGRSHAGLSGVALRELAREFVSSLHRLRVAQPSLDYQIIGIGGVMSGEDVRELYRLGADAVQSATGASLRPSLARESTRVLTA